MPTAIQTIYKSLTTNYMISPYLIPGCVLGSSC